MHGFTSKTMGGMTPFDGAISEINYSNPRVLAIKDQLGEFRYEPTPQDDGVKRKKKQLITLENGARYEGEWNEDSNKRDGRGY